MGDRVHQALEKMLPELEVFQTSGIFSQEEIKSIIERRRDFEYLINRPGKEKIDFIRYIEYEVNLEILRKKRMQSKAIRTLGEADSYGVNRIQALFRFALYKFKNDTQLWLQYIDFSMRIESRYLNRIFGMALQVHPYNPAFWIMAAEWEFKQLWNISTARALFQRGIRLNKKSTELYQEFIRLELMYIEQARKRKAAVGIDSEEVPKAGNNSKEVPKAGTNSEEVPKEGIDLSTLPDLENGQDKKKTEPLPEFLSLEQKQTITDTFIISRTIYNWTIKEIPDDYELRIKILYIFRLFEGTEKIQEEIYEHLARDFPTNPHVLAFVTKKPLDEYFMKSEQKSSIENYEILLQSVFSKFDEILENFSNWEFFLEYLKIIEENINFVQEKFAETVENIGKLIIKIYQKCKTKKEIWRELSILQFSQIFLKLQNFLFSVDCLNFGKEIFSDSIFIWVEFLNLVNLFKECELKEYKMSIDEILKLYHVAILKVPSKKAGKLLLPMIELEIQQQKSFEKIFEDYKKGLNFLQNSDQIEFFRQSVFDLVSHFDEDKVRIIYQTSLQYLPVSAEYYLKCIRWEKKNDSREILRQLFHTATREHGKTDHRLWLEFCEWEISIHEYQKASTVYWQAKKTLIAPEEFIVAHSELTNIPSAR